MKKQKQALSAVLLGLALSSSALASENPAFQSGLQSFRKGDYAAALRQFEAAQQSGMSTSGLYYNLGVVHYRLGNYEEARLAFEQASASRQFAQLAQYNLGLVALKEGDRQQAREAFDSAQKGEDARVASLAEEQIGRLDEIVGTEDGRWNFSLGIYGGYDDSIIDPVTLTGSPEGDAFSELFVGTRGLLSGNTRKGVRLDLTGYFVRYSQEDSNDADVFRAGLSAMHPMAEWQTSTGLLLEHSRLAGDDYLQAAHLAASAHRPLSSVVRLAVDYRVSLIKAAETIYQPQEGNRHQFDATLRRGDYYNYLEAGYRYEYNDREDLQEADVFTSYSPTRNQIRIGGRKAISEAIGIIGDVSFRKSNYHDPNTTADSGLITRDDSRTGGRLMLTGRVGRLWELELGYEHNDNDSNIDAYDYVQNLYWVGLNGMF